MGRLYVRTADLPIVLFAVLSPAALWANQGSWTGGGNPLKVPATVSTRSGDSPLSLSYTDPDGKTSQIRLSPGTKISITWDSMRDKPMVRVQEGRLDWDLNSVNALGFSAPRQTITVNNIVGYVVVETSDRLGGAGIVFMIGGVGGVITGTYFGLHSHSGEPVGIESISPFR